MARDPNQQQLFLRIQLATAISSSTAEALGEQPASPKKDGEDTKDGSKDASKDETRPQASNSKTERKSIIFAISALLRLIFFSALHVWNICNSYVVIQYSRHATH